MPHATRPSYFRSLSSSSQKDKPRLYIGLYPRCSGHDGCDAYHWTLVTGPATPARKDITTRHHLAHTGSHTVLGNDSQHSLYHGDDLIDRPHAQAELLVRITVAKVVDNERLQTVLQNLRVRSRVGNDCTEPSTCAQWVKDAFVALRADSSCLKSLLDIEDWDVIERMAREYCRGKRREGRFSNDAMDWWRRENVSTFNAWENRETTV
ncbi:hypothetical protein LTR62_001454 [Meristemomyces frigidus]|uniref:Uncharacterized protein n=1 Tax=Meristemomyces frigidus TaxID=1508187 RepID=A0AAN7YQJ3_9PEZI|nr:hypothetical protein LTR62_001454 [Meristemomyces frigidus]